MPIKPIEPDQYEKVIVQADKITPSTIHGVAERWLTSINAGWVKAHIKDDEVIGWFCVAKGTVLFYLKDKADVVFELGSND